MDKEFNKFITKIIIIGVIIYGMFITCVIIGEYKRNERIKYEFENRINDTIYVHVKDSTSIAQIDSLYSIIDSLETINYKYEDELNLALFKLERIKDYNEIAKKGNNIKYLRGWINRVLEE